MGYSLRVSVIDNCQLRCSYCLPFGPKNILPKNKWLSLEQYQHIALALKKFPIEKVRFTGGEPLLRPDISAIIKVFNNILGVSAHLTTNGLKFLPQMAELKNAGLSATTFHLDTLQEKKYGRLMGRGSVTEVIEAIKQARPLFLTKLNVVVQKGENDDELWDFLRLSKDLAVEVRFIELMNTGSAKDFVAENFLSGQEILMRIGQYDEIVPLKRKNPSDPAEQFLARKLDVPFGLIASDTRPFCQDCNRLRLSADGHIRTCLYEPLGYKIPLDLNVDDMARFISGVILKKTSFHPSLMRERKDFSMSMVGG